jgi:hypothetical protein
VAVRLVAQDGEVGLLHTILPTCGPTFWGHSQLFKQSQMCCSRKVAMNFLTFLGNVSLVTPFVMIKRQRRCRMRSRWDTDGRSR